MTGEAEPSRVEGYHRNGGTPTPLKRAMRPDWRRADAQALDGDWWAIRMPDGIIWQRYQLGDKWGNWMRVPGGNKRSWARFLKERKEQ